MNGYAGARMRRGMSIQELARAAGVSPAIVRQCESGDVDSVTLSKLLAVSRVLGLSIDGGLAEHEDPTVDRPVKVSLDTLLGRYMADKRLSTRRLAEHLGVSAQTVSVQARKDYPSAKYLAALAKEEEISVNALRKRYGDKEAVR